jgi:Tol biopolymer transport system component
MENGCCKMTFHLKKDFFSRLKKFIFFLNILFVFFSFYPAFSQDFEQRKWNGFGQTFFTIESSHFIIHYSKGLEQVAKQSAYFFENLYKIYSKTYDYKLPNKTKVLIIDGEITNGLADPIHNFIILWPHDFDVNLRGTHDWLKGVIAHEFAHIYSIPAAFKMPDAIPAIQIGFFTHPNEPLRTEALHIFPNEILPPWFTEGIAQYEDSRSGSDSWDTHRDMILRTLTISGRLLPYDRLFEFSGNGEDLEKTYNHGFSIVKYVSENYGYDKIVSITKECARFFRVNFDGAIKKILGISGRQLYEEWKTYLEKKYKEQIKNIGKQVYGKKINKEGYDNYWPKFSSDEKKIFFVSNGKADFSFLFKALYSYNLSDTVKEDKKIKIEKNISSFYSINKKSNLILFTSIKSSKSTMPASKGGLRTLDVFIDTLPSEKKKFNLFKKKTERQITKKESIIGAVFSPSGDKIAGIKRIIDRYYLCMFDTNGNNLKILYPDSLNNSFSYIYSLDWSARGNLIAISFIDSGFRKIGIYDTTSKEFFVLKNSRHDDRDPRFSDNGENLYFSSDRTGIFNIYRYNFKDSVLQKITNVSGGAFCPDVDKKEKRLVYANYDKDGYGIYLIDSIYAIEETKEDSFIIPYNKKLINISTVSSNPRPYLRVPNMFMLAPTFMMEQAIPQAGNVFKGLSVYKAGAVMYLEEPLASAGMGTQIGAYLLLEPNKIFNLIDLDKGGWGRKVSYDLGAFVSTKALPIELSSDFYQRQIPGSDFFYYDDSELGNAIMKQLNYAIILRNIQLMASHPLTEGINFHILGSYNWYEVFLLISEALENEDYPDPSYFPAQGYRLGSYVSLLAPEYDQRMTISPRGMALKLQYNFWSQNLLNEKGVTYENNKLKENYDLFNYHELSSVLKFGINTPWHKYHDIYAEIYSTSIITNEKLINSIFKQKKPEKNIPSFFMPIEWLRGYTFYFKDTLKKEDGSGDSVIYDTALICGNSVAKINLSYRFSLLPTIQIGKKIWFINLDQLYGAINFSAGAGWNNVSDIFPLNKQDWLSSAGAEIRLKAKSFGIPLAISFRYDYGFNRAFPLGGNHITFMLGFSFDNWDLIDMPDYSYNNLMNYK